MLAALIIAVSLSSTPDSRATIADLGPEQVARLEACGVDEARLETLLSLDQAGFDQDFTGGWRTVAAREGCDAAAADLIEVWRDRAPRVEDVSLLNWHAGQMRAFAGETAAAVRLFHLAKTGDAAWNLYADATMAFLQDDRRALEAVRAELATLAPSEEEMAARRRFLDDNPAITMPDGFVEQPQNLSVVDRLLECFGAPYEAAYSGQCAPEPAALADAACGFVLDRVAQMQAGSGEVALAVSPDWAASPAPRADLQALLRQEGRERENAPFGFAYDEAFAEATQALTDADLDRIAQAWAQDGAVECAGLDTMAAPFNADMAEFQAWAEANMTDPGPDAPPGASTLALSRPVLFDGGERLIVMEQSGYTPIPLSRPPSGAAAVVIYLRDGEGWAREASLILARGG